MAEFKPSPSFENISQRVVYSYLRQLQEYPSYFPQGLTPGELEILRTSEGELHDFFRYLYTQAFRQPELFGLPVKEDAPMVTGNTKDEKRVITIKYKKPRETMEYGIDFLYLIGKQGVLVDGNLHLDHQDAIAFFAKNPRVKRKFLKGMESVGLFLSEQDTEVVVSNPHYPHMMQALKKLAETCAHYADQRLGRFLFTRCDFRALNTDFQPDILDLQRHVLSSSSFKSALQLHQNISKMFYVPTLNMGGVSEWRIQYQGNKKIKATPFLEFEYDKRQESQFVTRVKCASTNRLVPFLHEQTASLQEDFFHHANTCGGAACGWCKTRKGMGPSVIRYGGEKRTICWYMQRHFTELDDKTVDMINQYAQLHEVLAAV